MKSLTGGKFQSVILEATNASSMRIDGVIQELWSGYGQIVRVALSGGSHETVVAKHVTMPFGKQHPRGWNSGLSHQRKLESYRVETGFYQSWAERCDERCRVPSFLTFAREGDEVLLVLEDLDAVGFPSRRTSVGWDQMVLCLEWLAEFHAVFMGESPLGLWETGTYWHLDTRPEELDALDDAALKGAAGVIDRTLRSARYQTFVHGDAKLANFCFSDAGDRVAALDFQYVGGGCGMKDVAYFIGSCLDETECETREADLLDCYFSCLERALERRQPEMDSWAVVAEWRELFPVAWADFHRFLKGWCPDHWKLNSYSERISRQVIDALGGK